MGRSIFADESVQVYIEQLMRGNKWFTGVIIGQVTQQRDYVIHITRTPDPVDDEAMEENGEGDLGETKTKPKKNIVQPNSLVQLDEKWVSTHAKQVCRMLPGGLSVIGLFALAPTHMLQASQVKLKQMMFSVHKSLTKNPLLVTPNEATDRVLLQIDSTTRKLTCSTLDMSDGKSTPRPADWKYQSVGSQWNRIESQLSVEIPMTANKESKCQSSLLKQLQDGLSDFCGCVRQAVISFDGAIKNGSDSLFTQKDKKGGGNKFVKDKGKREADSDDTISKATIILPLQNSSTLEDPVVGQSPAFIRICGSMTVRAFVPAKATVDDAIQAVKTDIVRGLYARCELLCEEDDVTEDEGTSSVYNPPIRYFYSSPNSTVDFCDYAFQDEKEEEMIQRIQELLDIDVETLENVESNATEEETWSYLSLGKEESKDVISATNNQATPSGALKAYIAAVVGGLLAVVATGISYMYLDE